MPQDRLKRSLRATFAGMAVNIALAGTKLAAGIVGHSHALVADAIESFLRRSVPAGSYFMRIDLEGHEVVTEQVSSDGTRKWLLKLAGETPGERPHLIETVYIQENDRGKLCVSSQVG